MIVADTAKLYDGGPTRRFVAAGPSIELSAKAALALAMMLHELATNATKYRALSTHDGTVAVTWSTRSGDPEAVFELIRQESDGPPVVPPTRRGFGSRLIQTAVPSSNIRLTYPATGVECVLVMTLMKLNTLR